MVALNPAYTPSKTLGRSQNRVGDFFCEGTDRFGTNRLSTHNRAGENGPIVMIIASGRSSWLSRDPIAENGGINLYAYVLNDPVNYVDPTGEIAFVPILVGIGVSMALDYLYDEYLSDHVNDYIDDNFDCKTQQGIRMAGTAAEIARSVKILSKRPRILRSWDRNQMM